MIMFPIYIEGDNYNEKYICVKDKAELKERKKNRKRRRNRRKCVRKNQFFNVLVIVLNI